MGAAELALQLDPGTHSNGPGQNDLGFGASQPKGFIHELLIDQVLWGTILEFGWFGGHGPPR